MSAAFELMFSYGRFLALSCMIIALLFYIVRFRRRGSFIGSGPSIMMAVLNFYITTKLLIYGNVDFFLGATAVILLSLAVFVFAQRGVEREAIDAESNQISAVAIAFWICGALIVVSNIAALLLYPESAFNDSLRMHGTTVNPQHLAMMCALIFPSFLFAIDRSDIRSLIGISSLALLLGVIVIEYNTGSRMGFAAVPLGLLVYFRNYIIGPRLFSGILVGLFIVALVVLLFDNELFALVNDRFIDGRSDTRSSGWDMAWEAFLENPLFGVEPQAENDRLIFVENFFLAAASTGGILAAALALAIVFGIFKLGQGVRLALKQRRIDRALANFYLSTLAVLFGVSIFEAALLGILTTHTMIAYVLLSGAASATSVRPVPIRRY